MIDRVGPVFSREKRRDFVILFMVSSTDVHKRNRWKQWVVFLVLKDRTGIISLKRFETRLSSPFDVLRWIVGCRVYPRRPDSSLSIPDGRPVKDPQSLKSRVT